MAINAEIAYDEYQIMQSPACFSSSSSGFPVRGRHGRFTIIYSEQIPIGEILSNYIIIVSFLIINTTLFY